MPTSPPPQQIALPEGPFSEYLRPVQPRPIDQPQQPFSGYENTPAAIGKVALGFLQGVRQNRVADYLENERRHQSALDLYNNHVNNVLRDDDLTIEGRRAIEQTANQHMHDYGAYETRDIQKGHGIGGFFKNIFVNATGGAMKGRKEWVPEDWHTAMGEVSALAAQHSQQANFNQLVQEAQGIKSRLLDQAQGGPVSQEALVRGLSDVYAKVIAKAPKYAGAFVPALTGGYPQEQSTEYQMAQLNRTVPGKPTAPPPAGPPPKELNYTPQSAYLPEASTMPVTASGVPFQETSAPPPPPVAMYPPGSPERFSMLSNLAGRPGSAIQISQQPHLGMTDDGQRVMGVMVMGSPNPSDNGYWNAVTQKKITGPFSAVGINSPHVVRPDSDGWAQYFDQNLGHMVYDLNADGQRYRVMRQPVRVWNPATQMEELVYPAESNVNGKPSGDMARDFLKVQTDRRTRFAEADKWLSQEKLKANQTFNNWINQIKSRNIDIAVQGMMGLGIQVDDNTVKQAMTNPQPLIDQIEAQRKKHLEEIDGAYQSTRQSIEQNFPASAPTAAPATAAPATAAPPPAPGPRRAPPGARTRMPIPSTADIDALVK